MNPNGGVILKNTVTMIRRGHITWASDLISPINQCDDYTYIYEQMLAEATVKGKEVFFE